MPKKHKNKNWIIPWGSIEYHGPHLPLLTDSIIAHHISKRIAEMIDTRVFKPINIGICFHMKGFSGTVSYSKDQVLQTFKKIIEKANTKKIDNLFLIIGHGENVNLVSYIFDHITQKAPLKILPFYIYHENILENIWKFTDSQFIFNIIHGGEIETSLMLIIEEKFVKLDKNMISSYPDISIGDLNEKYNEIPLGSFTSCGYFGDPTVASKEKGKEFLKIIIAHFFKEYHPIFSLYF